MNLNNAYILEYVTFQQEGKKVYVKEQSTCDKDRRYLLCQSPCPMWPFYTDGTP